MRPWTLDGCEESVFPEFFRNLEKLHHSKDLYAFGGSEFLVPLFREAGFVDIQVIKGSLDSGDWRTEPKDPVRQAASRELLKANVVAVPAIAANFKEAIPDNKERDAFAKRAVEDLTSGKFHMTFNFDTVIGRKPEIDDTPTSEGETSK